MLKHHLRLARRQGKSNLYTVPKTIYSISIRYLQHTEKRRLIAWAYSLDDREHLEVHLLKEATYQS